MVVDVGNCGSLFHFLSLYSAGLYLFVTACLVLNL